MTETLTLNMNDGTQIFCDNETWDRYTYDEKSFNIIKDNKVIGTYNTCDIFSVSVKRCEMIAYNKHNKPLCVL